MTKEELEKEAIKRIDAFIDTLSQDIRSTLYDRLNQEDVKDFLYGVYIDSAEPREKRIAELEKEKCELLGFIQGKNKAIADLKTTILKLRNCMNCKYRDTRGYSSCKDKGIVLCSHWEMKE